MNSFEPYMRECVNGQHQFFGHLCQAILGLAVTLLLDMQQIWETKMGSFCDSRLHQTEPFVPHTSGTCLKLATQMVVHKSTVQLLCWENAQQIKSGML